MDFGCSVNVEDISRDFNGKCWTITLRDSFGVQSAHSCDEPAPQVLAKIKWLHVRHSMFATRRN